MKSLCLTLLAALLLPVGAASAEGDAVKGENTFKLCAACHTASEPVNKVGPTLLGVVDRKVATAEGYRYSKAMTEFGADGKVWSEALLAEYLARPRAMVQGTSMAFAGVRKPEDIANLIAYLKNHPAAE